MMHNALIILYQSAISDGGPILSYSLSHGVRWFYPGHHQHYHVEYRDDEQQTQLLSA